ncbi:hypothetical protein T11_2274 [Trichinella zimbabwensis]|uniref:Uncharacterized protein n=1 Tax=Trichinella zimbabwensis TaxID=268475 RepID=A0A0V1GTH1_9BILA|nr:hypothetical protein T11_2274 [Trichinella zimbabwensis]
MLVREKPPRPRQNSAGEDFVWRKRQGAEKCVQSCLGERRHVPDEILVVGRKQLRAGQNHAELMGGDGTRSYEKWRSCSGEKGTVPDKKKPKLVWGKRHFAKQIGSQLVLFFGENDSRPHKKGAQLLWENGVETDKKRQSWLMENSKKQEKDKDETKSGYNCTREKGTGPYWKRPSCLAEKPTRVEQQGEKLMGENRQPAGQKGQRWLRRNTKKWENEGAAEEGIKPGEKGAQLFAEDSTVPYKKG